MCTFMATPVKVVLCRNPGKAAGFPAETLPTTDDGAPLVYRPLVLDEGRVFRLQRQETVGHVVNGPQHTSGKERCFASTWTELRA